jgi:serine/threonine protein kinase/TolB-like protein/Flp pilus assembly protein TadD
MTPERWQQINELFHSALEQERGRRAAFLAQACAGDEDLRQEVESLIASHERGESFIEAPASDVAAELLAGGQTKLAAGQNIAHYRITTLLGEGGMGEVYLAEDARLGRRIALKLLPAQFTRDAERVRRFEQEARSASALNHPNIITIHEIGQTDSLHFIATEFIDGETLRQHIAGKRAKLDEVLDIATQVASALAAAHEAGIVHRDIKPENIMLRSRDQIVKVLDFGLAKLALQSLAAVDTQEPTKTIVKTNPGLVLGTVQYMSPEQARGQEVDARTDIWSLGVVLYEMVAGRAPFEGETPSHLIVSIMEREPPPLSRYAQVPAELERIVTKTLRKNREERYQTAADLALDLKSLKQEQEVEARLKRAAQWDSDGKDTTTKSGAQAAVETVHEFAASTVNVATARSTSSAEYLIGEIRQHGRGVALTVAAVLVAVAALAYFYRTSGGEGIDSVAVLPFVDASGNPNTEYLSEGISDAVINSLSRLPKLRVISLNAVLRYKGKQIEPQAVGRELNVRAVLIGRMTQRGDSLAISAELVDVSDNRRLWGEQYSRKLSDILAVQDEIAREIAERLRLRLSNEDKKHLAKHYTEDTEAYRLYILGTYELRRGEGKEGFEQSIEYFEQAIRIDPNYALAYVGLQDTYHQLGFRGFWLPKEAGQKAEWSALKAVELDDTLPEAHVALGSEKLLRDWAGAEKEFKRALELDPNSANANQAYASYLVWSGRPDEALVYGKRGEELEQRQSGGFGRPATLPFLYFLARQYDTAIDGYKKAVEKSPNNAHFHFFLGEAYVVKGMYQEGVAELRKAVALNDEPARWDRYPILAYAYAVSGKRDEALKILDEQQRLAKQRYISPYNFAIIYTGLGDKDRAFEYLSRAYEEGVYVMNQFPVRPLFDSLRSDPRFTDLLRRMNRMP